MTSGTIRWSVAPPDTGSISTLNSGRSHPLCWSVLPPLAVTSRPPFPGQFPPPSPRCSPKLPASAPLAPLSKVSPVGSHLPLSSLAPAGRGPPGQCPAAAASAPRLPPRTPSLGGQRLPSLPRTAEGLSHLRGGRRGSGGGGGSRGGGGGEALTSLPGTRPGADRGWGGRLRAPSPKSHLPAAAGKVSPKA